mmetsp:Transcript_17122/g.26511  ORF Transcript_17122/g.26511 Transcript_17122/m.26511 type:complete len:129 (-) Transcript_17122:52-438(-)|eukprot:CAMPEP_0184298394 /NCGR_PEP_ID=MMETSP1049-20130417/9225_1 /TAXON_ID=77928 /ORGANISM="Proteomonas sulcata, Strain CCMP704" /LENGTH=128 /DNA_ID=CAMNT_0026608525 /DNA_START=227 /DNA_END=613 /DNA_ORIENTATION=+
MADVEMVDESSLRAAISAREKNVASLSTNPAAAVKASLADPPFSASTDETKKMSAGVVVKALSLVPEKETASVIDGLSPGEQDVLMKYIYRGMENGESCNQLLRWHAVLTEKAGMGCIMRALSEKQRV